MKGLVSEIVLVDDHSSDSTIEIAKKYGAKIFNRKLETCARQKQFALDQASSEWVLLLDSDEIATEELVNEIRMTVNSNHVSQGYKIPRKNIYFGKWLKFGGQYPDYQMRLFKKNVTRFSDHISHEKLMVAGELGRLKHWIEHNAYPDIETWFLKLKRTAEFDARELERKGIRPSLLNYLRFCLIRPLWRFDRRFFLKGGFLDGLSGLLASLHDVLTQIFSYLILSQKYRSEKKP